MPSAGFLSVSDSEPEFGSARNALALLELRNSLQKRHLIAAAWMVSAQNGHCFVCGGLNVVVSIQYISEVCRKLWKNGDVKICSVGNLG